MNSDKINIDAQPTDALMYQQRIIFALIRRRMNILQLAESADMSIIELNEIMEGQMPSITLSQATHRRRFGYEYARSYARPIKLLYSSAGHFAFINADITHTPAAPAAIAEAAFSGVIPPIAYTGMLTASHTFFRKSSPLG